MAGLPRDLPAALMAVIHTNERSTSLADVLARCSHRPVVTPESSEPIQPGPLYLPLPNRHLVVKDHSAFSWMGPRENRHRPAVDALFRSAARVYRSRAIAVVLSGALDDGSAGALAIKSRGGIVMVEDPKEAQVPDMPASVLRQVKTDYCLPLAELGPKLNEIVAANTPMDPVDPLPKEREGPGVGFNIGEGDPPGYTCPDCGGALVPVREGDDLRFRCHVGHEFSLNSFTDAHADALERALWVALRRLNEQRTIMNNLYKGEQRNPALKSRYAENAAAAEHDMHLLHEILARL